MIRTKNRTESVRPGSSPFLHYARNTILVRVRVRVWCENGLDPLELAIVYSAAVSLTCRVHSRQSYVEAAGHPSCRRSQLAHSRSNALSARNQCQRVMMMTPGRVQQAGHMMIAAPVTVSPASCCCCCYRCHHDLLALNDSSVTLRHSSDITSL